jgi:hypothetical protein
VRLWVRSLVIVLATIAGFYAIVTTRSSFVWLVVLVAAANAAFYAFCRCPKCGKWGCRLPSGRGVALTGLRCRYCGVEY